MTRLSEPCRLCRSREDAYAEPTNRYSDFGSALTLALKECGFEVPEDPQGTLFEM